MYKWLFFCCVSMMIMGVCSGCKKGIPLPSEMGILTLEDFEPFTFIGAENVEPEPQSNLSLAEFNAARGMKQEGTVCIRLDGTSVLENDDQGLGLDDYLDRSKLTIDGQVISRDKILNASDLFMTWTNYEYDIEQEKYVPLKPNGVGPYQICWEVDLGVGTHTVEFKTQKTSGEERSFSWEFTITE